MKTGLIIGGVILLVLLVLGGAGAGYFFYERNQANATSKAYVDESVPAIVSNWSKDELVKRESPQLAQSVSDDDITAMFTKLGGLGPMKSYDGATGGAHVRISHTGLHATASYVAAATFQNAKANVKIDLVQINGNWLIQGFGVGAPNPAQ